MTAIVTESRLAAGPATVWARVSTMQGVNRELMPIVRMTYPPEMDSLDAVRIEPGAVAFRSWLLLLGFIPYDLHSLRLVSVDPGRGFHEESFSWTQRRWTHLRTLTPIDGGTLLGDEVDFETRLPFFGILLRPIIRAIFNHRHRVLRRDFGEI